MPKVINTLLVVSVKSGCISKLAYNKNTRDCFVKFTDGSCYVDKDVDPNVFDAWLKAPSIGKFYHKYIKKAHDFRRIKDDKLTFEL